MNVLMTSSFRLGRIAGIEIGANWSWLLIVTLMTDVSRLLEVQEKLASAAFDRSDRVGRAAARAGIRDEALTR